MYIQIIPSLLRTAVAKWFRASTSNDTSRVKVCLHQKLVLHGLNVQFDGSGENKYFILILIE